MEEWGQKRCAEITSMVPSMDSTQPLLCTCSPSSSYFQSCKSQSVPEGLSTMSQQCKCKPQPSREYIYVPRQLSQHPHHQTPSQHLQQQHLLQHNHNCSCHNLKQLVSNAGVHSNTLGKPFKDTLPPHASATMPKCKLKRSQSLSRPMTYVEQMTTSV
ncbi:uncharacterized protein LOC142225287 [Haematobia irritans]|uniref:uncharacterized protein LOC142225287 n=1 Tax=Haematobia irritans TaxID=7368 RepID=UPI003F500512